MSEISEIECVEIYHGEWVNAHQTKEGNRVKGYCRKKSSSGYIKRIKKGDFY